MDGRICKPHICCKRYREIHRTICRLSIWQYLPFGAHRLRVQCMRLMICTEKIQKACTVAKNKRLCFCVMGQVGTSHNTDNVWSSGCWRSVGGNFSPPYFRRNSGDISQNNKDSPKKTPTIHCSAQEKKKKKKIVLHV